MVSVSTAGLAARVVPVFDLHQFLVQAFGFAEQLLDLDCTLVSNLPLQLLGLLVGHFFGKQVRTFEQVVLVEESSAF